MSADFGLLESLELTVLLENYAGVEDDLLSQQGFSVLCETASSRGRKTILFDCGQTAAAVLHNMKILEKDPAAIDMIVLSHCHYDHSGGLSGILEAIGRPRIPVIAHPLIHRPCYKLKPHLRSIGMGPVNRAAALEEKGGDLVLAAEPLPLAAGVVVGGEIKKRVTYEKEPADQMLTTREGQLVPDLMPDERTLLFIVNHELIILAGCSHPGIVSMIEAAVELMGVDHIAAIVGGFHLINAPDERIRKTIDDLTLIKAAEIYTGHCTGLKAEALLLQELPKRFHKLHTGMSIKF